MSAWEKVKNFIRGKSINDTITRKDLLKIHRFANTIDTYRIGLTNVGVLKTIKPGIYVKKRNIRENLTWTELKAMAWSNDWRSWFIQVDQ